MGLLNRMLGIVGEGLAKSASDALGKAVSQAVKPAAEKFAEKQADLINAVTKNIENAAESVRTAGDSLNEAGKALNETASQTDPEQLKMAMEFLRQNARIAADEISKIEAEEKPSDEEQLAKWDTLLSDYPKWSCGGKEFEYEEYTYGENDDRKGIRFTFDGCEAYTLAYQAVLIANGFQPKWRHSSSNQVWYKQAGNRYPAVFFDDIYDSQVTLAFYDEDWAELERAMLSR